MLDQLIPFLTASILLTFSPGPDIIYVLVRSIAYGYKQGIITALGLVSGILIHTSLVAFGVSAVIKQSEDIFFIILWDFNPETRNTAMADFPFGVERAKIVSFGPIIKGH